VTIDMLPRAPKYKIGDGKTFMYAGAPALDDWRVSVWWLAFYETRIFMVLTEPAAAQTEPETS